GLTQPGGAAASGGATRIDTRSCSYERDRRPAKVQHGLLRGRMELRIELVRVPAERRWTNVGVRDCQKRFGRPFLGHHDKRRRTGGSSHWKRHYHLPGQLLRTVLHEVRDYRRDSLAENRQPRL